MNEEKVFVELIVKTVEPKLGRLANRSLEAILKSFQQQPIGAQESKAWCWRRPMRLALCLEAWGSALGTVRGLKMEPRERGRHEVLGCPYRTGLPPTRIFH